MIRQVAQWSLLPADHPGVAAANFAYHTLLECGHVFELHGQRGGVLTIPSHVECGVCAAEAEEAARARAAAGPKGT